jgi:hypothetical protein
MPAPEQPKVQYSQDYYTYQVNFASIAAGASASGSFQVQADSDFKWLKATCMADLAGVAQTVSAQVIPLVTINITDTGSGRQLMSAPVPIWNMFGTGQIPFILPVPRIFKARANVAITLANYSAATAYLVRLSFIGTKVFQMS